MGKARSSSSSILHGSGSSPSVAAEESSLLPRGVVEGSGGSGINIAAITAAAAAAVELRHSRSFLTLPSVFQPEQQQRQELTAQNFASQLQRRQNNIEISPWVVVQKASRSSRPEKLNGEEEDQEDSRHAYLYIFP